MPGHMSPWKQMGAEKTEQLYQHAAFSTVISKTFAMCQQIVLVGNTLVIGLLVIIFIIGFHIIFYERFYRNV